MAESNAYAHVDPGEELKLSNEDSAAAPPPETLANFLAADAAESSGTAGSIEIVHVGASEVAVIPFTTNVTKVVLHYVDDADLRSYVRCNGARCLLCAIGNERVDRALLPVYVPTARAVQLLAISPNRRPGALGPQLVEALGNASAALVLSKSDRIRYRVEAVALRDSMDNGNAVIAAFLRNYDAGRIQLDSAYPQLDNEAFGELGAVKAMMQIKGIVPGHESRDE